MAFDIFSIFCHTTQLIPILPATSSGELTVKENRKIGFPWSLSGVQRSTSSVGNCPAVTARRSSQCSATLSAISEQSLDTIRYIQIVFFLQRFFSIDCVFLFLGGTVAAMRAVCGSSSTVAGHLAGGTHHAFRGVEQLNSTRTLRHGGIIFTLQCYF
jgi:hypothetical protein